LATEQLGLRANWQQFSLLVLINAFVGAMVGLERSILPALAEEEFGVAAKAAVLSFIVAFGLSKAATNYVAGRLGDRFGRRPVLLAGWAAAIPVPFVLMYATAWWQIVAVNVLLGVSQGLAWSTTVIMKIDLAGPKQRGLAMGLNEFAGYLAVGLSAAATGYLAAEYGLRPEPFYLGVAYVAIGGLLSLLFVRETLGLVHSEAPPVAPPSDLFVRTSFRDPNLSSSCQAGMVNNLNDGMAWGLFPLVHAAAGMSVVQIGWLAAIYPSVWGLFQLITGPLSDKYGRKGFIVSGMLMQSAAIVGVATASGFAGYALSAVFLGLGTAMVYPTLLAAIADGAAPSWRGSAVGIYRLWRDGGYAVGAVFAGIVADRMGLNAAVWGVAGLTLFSGVIVQLRMR